VPVGDATAITSTVAPGTVLAALDSLVCLFVRSPRPPGVTNNNDDAIGIVVVPYAVDPSEASTRIRPSAIGNPSNPTIAAHRATSFLFNTTAANNIPSVIDIDALPTTWGHVRQRATEHRRLHHQVYAVLRRAMDWLGHGKPDAEPAAPRLRCRRFVVGQ
jgi:hypothetical protein